jgi:outer membrane protein OmpA-like peptidoglycan-associated protein
MKKFIFSLITMLMVAMGVNAQIATENQKIFDNVYVGVEAGVSTPFNFNSMFPLNTVAGIKVGKELTPVFGLEVEGLASFGDNVYRYGYESSTPVWAEGPFNVHKNGSINTFVKATNVGLNGVINWSNLLFGYQGTPRFFEVKTNTGFGWLHYFGDFTTNKVGGYKPYGQRNVLTAKTAIDFAFNLGNKKAHTITVSPGIYWALNNESNIKFNKNYAQFGIMVGYTYHFKTSNGTSYFKTYDVGAMADEIARLNDELAQKPKEVIVDKVVEIPATAAVQEHATGFGINETVYFAYDSDVLDARAKETLDKLGENGVYVIDAYASSEGSTEYNKELSQRRADAVKAYLENRGAKVDSAVGHGVQFGTTTGRVAIVKVK